MPQGQKPLCLIHFWVNPIFPFPAPAASSLPLSGVIRKGSPSIKVRKVEFFWNKISFTGGKWSNLNAPGSETPVSHSLLGESLFPISSPCCFSSLPLSRVIRKGSPSIKIRKVEFFWNKISFTGGKWSNSNAQGQKPLCLIHV